MIFCGIDEAGRGPLAGPVVVAGVIMRKSSKIEGIKDSKKLTFLKRDNLFQQITENALHYEIQIIDEKTIDDINILKSCMLGMESVMNKFREKCDKYLIDGNYLKFHDDRHISYNYETIVKGDDKVYEISCASILAKVTRDRIMIESDILYPEYGFKNHKGYATKKHIEAILNYGPCKIHRTTFLKNILQLHVRLK